MWTVYGCIGEFNEGFSLGIFDEYGKAEKAVENIVKGASYRRSGDRWYVTRDDRIQSKYVIFIESHVLNEFKIPRRFN